MKSAALTCLALIIISDSVQSLQTESSLASEPWLNAVWAGFDFWCPRGWAISGFRSVYRSRYKDRQWAFTCTQVPRLTVSTAKLTDVYSTSSFGNIDFQCKDGGLVVGVSSPPVTDRSHPKRHFKFTCASLMPPRIISCHHLETIPRFHETQVGEEIEFHLDPSNSKGFGISGLKGTFNSDANDHKWETSVSRWRGCTCSPGFTGDLCEISCRTIPCSLKESRRNQEDDLSFYCPPNHVIKEIYNEKDAEGKVKWAFGCRFSPLLIKDVTCKTYFFSYRFDKTMEDFICPDAGLLAGFVYNQRSNPSDPSYGLHCCNGLPRNGQSCQLVDTKQGEILNKNGGGFNYTVNKIFLGIAGMSSNFSREQGVRIWRPTLPVIACNCHKETESAESNWGFLWNALFKSVLAIGKTKDKVSIVTLQLPNGSDSQMWTMKNGVLINREGFAIDIAPDRSLIPAPPTGSPSQAWRYIGQTIFNPKLRLFVSTHGFGEDGMRLTVLNLRTTIDSNWLVKRLDSKSLCVRSCEKNPCRNGGSCVENSQTGYECNCPPGFVGRNCEENINECLPSLCKNGATCVDKINDYECICAAGFRGRDCDLTSTQKIPDVRCVDVVPNLTDGKNLIHKIEICRAVQDGIQEDLSVKTIIRNLVVSGFPLSMKFQLLKIIAVLSKSKDNYENFPLNCIRKGKFKSMAEILAAMKDARLKTMTEEAQNKIFVAVNFFASRVVEGDQSMVKLLASFGEECDEGPCTRDDVLTVIARRILPNKEEYDDFDLRPYRKRFITC